jgi:hypothetical protein
MSSDESGAKATENSTSKEFEKQVSFEVCKYKNTDGSLSDNCVYAVLKDGTCGDAGLKVKSEKPADQYTCLVEL